jgi:hypothetical protein
VRATLAPHHDRHLSESVPSQLRQTKLTLCRQFSDCPRHHRTRDVGSFGAGRGIESYPWRVSDPVEHGPVLVGTYHGSTIGIPTTLLNSLSLKVGGSYVFFFTQDPSNPLCVVAGLRGGFSYNPATRTVSRVDHNPQWQIPPTKTLSQLENQLNEPRSQSDAAAAADIGKPIPGNFPPYCSSSATGL